MLFKENDIKLQKPAVGFDMHKLKLFNCFNL